MNLFRTLRSHLEFGALFHVWRLHGVENCERSRAVAYAPNPKLAPLVCLIFLQVLGRPHPQTEHLRRKGENLRDPPAHAALAKTGRVCARLVRHGAPDSLGPYASFADARRGT